MIKCKCGTDIQNHNSNRGITKCAECTDNLRRTTMIVVKATWYTTTEEQADEMVRSLVEKYKVGINYSAEVYEEEENEDD